MAEGVTNTADLREVPAEMDEDSVLEMNIIAAMRTQAQTLMEFARLREENLSLRLKLKKL